MANHPRPRRFTAIHSYVVKITFKLLYSPKFMVRASMGLLFVIHSHSHSDETVSTDAGVSMYNGKKYTCS